MQAIVLFSLLSLLIGDIYCQTTDQYEKAGALNYEVIVEAPISECDISGNVIISNNLTAIQGSVFSLIEMKANIVVIKFWKWVDDNNKNKYNINENGETRFFRMSIEDFKQKTIRRYTRKVVPTVGTVIVPVKIRFNTFDFAKDITIGTTAGARIRMSKYSDNFFNVLIGIGISAVTLDSSSTKGRIANVSDRPALTPSIGLVLEFSNNIQMGFFTGMDYISSKENLEWKYQGKPWLSIGIGYTILSRQIGVSAERVGRNQ